jgi:hypothetical protein
MPQITASHFLSALRRRYEYQRFCRAEPPLIFISSLADITPLAGHYHINISFAAAASMSAATLPC